VHQSRGQFSLSNLRRKSGVKNLEAGSAGEGSKATTCEHLQIFPSSGEQIISRGGVKTTVRSTAGRDRDHQIRSRMKEERARRRTEPIHQIWARRTNKHWIQVKCIGLNPLCA
jgi:hypothetical protein